MSPVFASGQVRSGPKEQYDHPLLIMKYPKYSNDPGASCNVSTSSVQNPSRIRSDFKKCGCRYVIMYIHLPPGLSTRHFVNMHPHIIYDFLFGVPEGAIQHRVESPLVDRGIKTLSVEFHLSDIRQPLEARPRDKFSIAAHHGFNSNKRGVDAALITIAVMEEV